MQCIITEKHSNEINEIDETKKMTQYSQIVRAKENLMLSHGGPFQRQAVDTIQRMKALRQGRH